MSVDPTGRSIDPAYPQTFNRYSYARNNPVNRLDPDGEADIKSEAASSVFGMLPGAGEFQDATIAITGYDPITSEKQSMGTRVFAGGAFFVPLAGASTIKNVGAAIGAGAKKLWNGAKRLFGGGMAQLSSNPILNAGLNAAVKGSGDGAARASAFENGIAGAIRDQGGELNFTRGATADGGTVFVGDQGHSVLFTQDGRTFRGNANNPDHFSQTENGLLPNLDNLDEIVSE